MRDILLTLTADGTLWQQFALCVRYFAAFNPADLQILPSSVSTYMLVFCVFVFWLLHCFLFVLVEVTYGRSPVCLNLKAGCCLSDRICFVLLQDKGMMNFPEEQYNVPDIKASASTFDDLVVSLRSEARRRNNGGW